MISLSTIATTRTAIDNVADTPYQHHVLIYTYPYIPSLWPLVSTILHLAPQVIGFAASNMSRRQTQYLTPPLILQLNPHHPTNPRPHRFARLLYQHTSIIIKPNRNPVLALIILLGPNYDCVANIPPSDAH